MFLNMVNSLLLMRSTKEEKEKQGDNDGEYENANLDDKSNNIHVNTIHFAFIACCFYFRILYRIIPKVISLHANIDGLLSCLHFL